VLGVDVLGVKCLMLGVDEVLLCVLGVDVLGVDKKVMWIQVV